MTMDYLKTPATFFSPVARALGDSWIQLRVRPGPFFLIWLCFSILPALILKIIAVNGILPVLLWGFISTALTATCLGVLVHRIRTGDETNFRILVSDGLKQFGGFLLTQLSAILRTLWLPLLGNVIPALFLNNAMDPNGSISIETLMILAAVLSLILFLVMYGRYFLAPFLFLVTGERGIHAVTRSVTLFKSRRMTVSTLLILGFVLPPLILGSAEFLYTSPAWLIDLFTIVLSAYEVFIFTAFINFCLNTQAVPE